MQMSIYVHKPQEQESRGTLEGGNKGMGEIICVEVSGRKEGSHTLLHLIRIHGDMVVVRRRKEDVVVFLLDHLLVSIAFLDFVGVPMAVFVVGGTVVICLTIPLLCVTLFTFLECKWGPLFLFSLSLSFDGDLEVDSFLGDDEHLGLFCCCWASHNHQEGCRLYLR